jgi:hypothetical protein
VKRFKFDIYKKLAELVKKNNLRVRMVYDLGFIRFDCGHLDAIYLLCTFQDMHPGFVKFQYDGEFAPHSFYYTENEHLELRFDLEGKEVAKYIIYPDGDSVVYNKIVDGVKTDAYIINKDDKKLFPEYDEQVSKYVEADEKEFSFFTKEGRQVVYLQVK